jgi:iron(III) transport system substrate-binding protein
MLPGNAQVKDAVAVGRYAVGFSDTDDVSAALLDGQPVRLIIPDQGEAELGVFIIPNAVALISGAPHAENGRRLVEFLLSPDVERLLAQADGAQIPIRHNVPGPRLLPPLSRLKVMKVDYDEVGRSYERMLEIVDEEWPR